MRRTVLLLALAVALNGPLHARRATHVGDAALEAASELREKALHDDTGWKVVESLTQKSARALQAARRSRQRPPHTDASPSRSKGPRCAFGTHRNADNPCVLPSSRRTPR